MNDNVNAIAFILICQNVLIESAKRIDPDEINVEAIEKWYRLKLPKKFLDLSFGDKKLEFLRKKVKSYPGFIFKSTLR